MQPQKINRKRKIDKKETESFVNLTLRKKKSKLAGRLGSHKEKMTKASNIKVNDKSKEKNVINEEQTSCYVSGEQEFVEQIFISSDDSIEEEAVSTGQDFALQSDISSLKHNRMLSDVVINLFQRMLKKQHPNVRGLQDTLLGNNLQFDVIKTSFVQILYTGSHHWIAISTLGCNKGEVYLLDSLCNGRLTYQTKRQICSILHCKKDKIKVKVVPVQQQKNGVDCGLFAVAFIQYVIVKNVNPTMVTFDQLQMRSHAIKAIESGRLDMFPTSQTTVKRYTINFLGYRLFS